MGLLKPFLVTAFSLWLLSYLLETINITNWTALILASLVIVLLNTLVKPILKLVFLPINIITLGFFSVVINVALLWLATYLVPGFEINNMVILGVAFNQFFSILFASILIGFAQSLFAFIL